MAQIRAEDLVGVCGSMGHWWRRGRGRGGNVLDVVVHVPAENDDDFDDGEDGDGDVADKELADEGI